MQKIFGFTIFLVNQIIVNSRAVRDPSDMHSYEFMLTNLGLHNSILVVPNSVEANYADNSNRDLSYDSEETEKERIEKYRRIFEMAGARFSPNFEPLRKSTTPNMNDL